MKLPPQLRLRDVFGFLFIGEVLGLVLANLIEYSDVPLMQCGAVVGAILGALADRLAPRFDPAHPFRTIGVWLIIAPISLLLYYCIMFGPACRVTSDRRNFIAPRIYWPIGYVAVKNYPGPVYRVISRYAGGRVWIPAHPTDHNQFAQ